MVLISFISFNKNITWFDKGSLKLSCDARKTERPRLTFEIRKLYMIIRTYDGISMATIIHFFHKLRCPHRKGHPIIIGYFIKFHFSDFRSNLENPKDI